MWIIAIWVVSECKGIEIQFINEKYKELDFAQII